MARMFTYNPNKLNPTFWKTGPMWDDSEDVFEYADLIFDYYTNLLETGEATDAEVERFLDLVTADHQFFGQAIFAMPILQERQSAQPPPDAHRFVHRVYVHTYFIRAKWADRHWYLNRNIPCGFWSRIEGQG
ncbi:hypothetical protein LTS17_010665 [Exophiala oligosperma]